MNPIVRRRPVCLWIGLLLVLPLSAGCEMFAIKPPDNNGNARPGRTFANAGKVIFDATGNARLTGSINSNDADVYDIGPMTAGDRITVTVMANNGDDLDPTTAIFDNNQELFTLNDDVDINADRLDSLIDEVIRVDGNPYYLGIARSSFSPGTSGDYVATLQIVRGGRKIGPSGQTAFLNFAGGRAVVPNVDTYDLPPFNASDIDNAYAGQTEDIKRTIVETVKSNFHGLNLLILDSDNHDRPSGSYSEIFFGAFDGRAFGISESVDHLNTSKNDRSIVYTDRFDDPFSPRPSAHGVGVAIGNVAAHEIGHLLGLEHTADITDLMDTTGRAGTLLADQNFKNAVLDDSVFPIGTQDGFQLLSIILGTL